MITSGVQRLSRSSFFVGSAALMLGVFLSVFLSMAHARPSPAVFLTEEEKQWLDQHPIIKVAVDANWAPLEYVDKQGRLQGISRDYLDKLEDILGVTFEPTAGESWQDVVEKVKRLELDMFSSVRPTPERATYLNFTSEYISQPIMIFSRANVPYIGNLEKLHGRKVAGIESYAVYELLKTYHPEIELVSVPSIEEAVRLVARGEVNAFVGNINITTYYLNKLGLAEIKVVGETPYRSGQAMAVRKDWPILATILDKAIKTIPAEEQQAIQQRWLSTSFESQTDYTWLWKLLIPLLAVCLLAFYWNWRLAKEIYARKQTERDLKNHQKRLNDLFTVIPSGIWDWDMVSDRLFCSPAYFEILGYAPEDFEPHTLQTIWLDLIHSEDSAITLDIHHHSVASDEPFSHEYRLRCKDGRYKWVLDKGHVVERNEAGEPVRMIGSYVDIDAAKQLEQQLRDAKEAAEAANLAKSLFLANMSHELRTPLNAVLGFSEMMSRDRDMSLAHKDSLSMIHQSGRHLLNLINNVLDMSKIEAGHASLELSACSLSSLLSDVEAIAQGRTLDSGLTFIPSYQAGLPEYVLIDGGKVKQILINLLGNAFKFTQRGQVAFRVSGQCLDDSRWCLHFCVEDTGKGISEDKQSMIFEPFMQAEAHTSGQNGTGLGLAISRQFTQLMNGKLSLNSKLGEGSQFCLDLTVEAVTVVESELPKPKATILGLADEQPEWRVLIAEDQFSNRALLKSQLEKAGFTVKEAKNGRQAVQLFQHWQPHLIWMDIQMPIMDGYEALKNIRALAGGDEVKVLALTASAFRQDSEAILKAGFDAVYHKPYFEQDMLAAMAEHLPLLYEMAEQGVETAIASASRSEVNEGFEELPASEILRLLAAARVGDVAELQVITGSLDEEFAKQQSRLEEYVKGFELQRLVETLEQLSV